MAMKLSDIVEVKNQRKSGRYSKGKVSAGHFVEDYMKGDIDVLVDWQTLMANKEDFWSYNLDDHHWKFFLTRFIPEVTGHSQKQDTRIVRDHYDNKNDLFSWFLGPRMIYTSGFYEYEDQTLEQAQDNKMNMIAQKMQIKEGHKHLDIGCGWGTMVMHFAKEYGTNSTGVTLAGAGADYARQQIKDNGVSDRAKILTMDYRDIPQEKYDRITCLEMAEHVGVKNFYNFMTQIYDLLADDGVFYLQIAALRERKSPLWGPNMEDIVWGLFMNKYIFAGADASMPLNWDLKRVEDAGFEVHSVENVGKHYSRTIDAWYDYWMSNKEKCLEKYGQQTFRMYEVFLSWSVAIAAQGSSTAYQIVCHKNLDKFDREMWIGKDKYNMGAFDTLSKAPSAQTEGTHAKIELDQIERTGIDIVTA